MDNQVVIEHADASQWQVLEVRPFVWREWLTVRSARYIPTYRGADVCLRRWSGREDFLPLEGAPEMPPHTKISLFRLLLVTYQRPDGTTLHHVRLKGTDVSNP